MKRSSGSEKIGKDNYPAQILAGETDRICETGSSHPEIKDPAERLGAEVAARKRAEKEVRRLNAEMAELVRRHTAEVEAANRELESFSYSISHDLRAPLRAMGGFARILETQFSDEISTDAQHSIKRIRENAALMGQLIDGLLSFSRLTRQPLAKRTVDPAAIARAVFDELSSESAGRRIEIEVGELPACEADLSLLRQVFANLLANAIKYSRGRDPAVIKVGSRRENGECVYFVQDNGAGFEMEYASKLFRVFQRLHHADQFEGTGVGLAIVQRIVQRHGGRIWAEAQVDRGAAFYFTLGGPGNG